MVKKAFVLGIVYLIAVCGLVNAETPVLTKQQLQADFAILKRAYTELHPGLYRYAGKAAVGRYFDELEARLQKDMTVPEAYVEFSRFLGKIRCGHTYANFWNQSKEVQQQVFGKADKVPFTFRLIDQRMIVIENASADDRLRRGTEIAAINGVSVKEILANLIPLVKGDGSNDAKRLHDLQLTGDGEFEAFDVYFPLLYPPASGTFRLDTGSGIVNVPAVTRAQRAELIEKRSGKKPVSNDDLWKFEIQDGRMAYLKLGTFANWQMKLDWRAFLKNAFEEMSSKNVSHLILDIRGNEGGADEVKDELLTWLLSKPVKAEGRKQLLRYRKIPADLNPYLSSWDDSFRDFGDKVKDLGDGFYTWTDAKAVPTDLPASERAFRGKVYLLVDAANSSATFHLAALLKESGLATLVGEPTGGNRRGTTGGRIAFMKLPNSGIEMDIPLVGTFPLTEQPDEGIVPDVVVKPAVEDVVKGVDTQLEAVRRLITEASRARAAEEEARKNPPKSGPTLQRERGYHFGSPLKLSAHASRIVPLRKDTIEYIEGPELLAEVGAAGVRLGVGWGRRNRTYYGGDTVSVNMLQTWSTIVDPLGVAADRTLANLSYRIIMLGLTLRGDLLYDLDEDGDPWLLGWSAGVSW